MFRTYAKGSDQPPEEEKLVPRALARPPAQAKGGVHGHPPLVHNCPAKGNKLENTQKAQIVTHNRFKVRATKEKDEEKKG